MSASGCRTFQNDPAGLRTMSEWFNEVVANAGLDGDVAWKAEVCLYEAAANIVMHGYDDGKPHSIRVEVEPAADAVRITVVDDGRPFNPLDAVDPPPAHSLEEAPVGGLGIHLIRAYARHLEYRRDGHQNVLRLTVGRNSGT